MKAGHCSWETRTQEVEVWAEHGLFFTSSALGKALAFSVWDSCGCCNKVPELGLGGLKQVTQFRRPSQGVGRAMLSLTALGESPSSSLLASRVCLDPWLLSLWSHGYRLTVCLHTVCPLCTAPCPNFPFCTDTGHFQLGLILMTSFKLESSVKTLLPNVVTF